MPSQVLRFFVFLVLVLALAASTAVAQTKPDKVYVPDPIGDVSPRVAAVIASEISAALIEHGIQAFTFSNPAWYPPAACLDCYHGEGVAADYRTARAFAEANVLHGLEDEAGKCLGERLE